MNTKAVAYSPIFFLIKEHLEQLKLPLRLEFNGLITEVRNILHDRPGNLEAAIEDILPQLFNIRVQCVEWILEEEGHLNFDNIYEEMYDIFSPLMGDKKYGLLAENCSFAIRTNHRVLKSILTQLGSTGLENGIQEISHSQIDYHQLINALKSSIPYSKELKNLIDWFDTSLRIEFVLFCLVVIDEHKLDIQEEIVDKLSELVINDSQQYYAIAKMFGLVPQKYPPEKGHELSNLFISEQQDLSELGINDFLNSID